MPSRPAVQEAACSPVPWAGLTTQIAGALQAKGELRGFCGFDFGNYCIGRSHRLGLGLERAGKRSGLCRVCCLTAKRTDKQPVPHWGRSAAPRVDPCSARPSVRPVIAERRAPAMRRAPPWVPGVRALPSRSPRSGVRNRQHAGDCDRTSGGDAAR